MIKQINSVFEQFLPPADDISDLVERSHAAALSNLLGFLLLLCLAGALFLPDPRQMLLTLSPVLLGCWALTRGNRWRLGGWIALSILSLAPFIAAAAGWHSAQSDILFPLLYLTIPILVALYLLDTRGVAVLLAIYTAAILALPYAAPSAQADKVGTNLLMLAIATILSLLVVRRREAMFSANGRSNESAEMIKQLEESEQRTHNLFNFSNDAIMFIDPKSFTILDINENAVSHFGIPRPELIGRHVDSLFAGNPAGEDVCLSEKMQSQAQSVIEMCINHPEGHDIPVEIRSQRLENAGHPVYHCIVRDVGERKFLEEQLRQHQERLETLHQIEQAMISVHSPEEIADVALNRLRLAVNCRRADLCHFNYASQEVIVMGVDEEEGLHELPPSGAHIAFDDIRIAEELQDGSLFREKDIAQVRQPKKLETLLAEAGINSYISLPVFVQGELWGALNLCGPMETRSFTTANIEVALEVVRLMAVAIQQTHLFREIRLGRARLQALSRRLVEAQEAERQRIANELHDEIGQALTGINLSLETHMRAQQGGVDHGALLEAQKTAEELIARVQAISLDLRPAMLDDLGLLPTFTWHFDRYESQTGIQVNFEHRHIHQRFGREIETAAYRIVQEALTNVARHSKVKQVKVRASLEENAILLFIEDRGGGFSVEKSLLSGDASGLVGMRERALSLGGDLTIISTEGSGSQVLAKLPLIGRVERRASPRNDD